MRPKIHPVAEAALAFAAGLLLALPLAARALDCAAICFGQEWRLELSFANASDPSQPLPESGTLSQRTCSPDTLEVEFADPAAPGGVRRLLLRKATP